MQDRHVRFGRASDRSRNRSPDVPESLAGHVLRSVRAPRRWVGFGMIWVAGLVAGAVLLIALATVMGPPAAVLVSRAAPAKDYADAVSRVTRQQSADDRVVVPGGRSVLMAHGGRTGRVVVLFHGLTNSPRQYEHIASHLYASGDTVYIPRLPHHAESGGTVRTLAALTAEELQHCADSAIDIAYGLGDSVVAVGVSAGGTLVAWIAQHRPDVHRALIIAPVLEIGRVPSFLAAPLMNLGLRLPNITRNLPADPARPDRQRGVSTRAVAQLLRLGSAVRQVAQRTPSLTRDIVFVVNANDHTVKTSPALELARRWSAGGASVAVFQFPRSLHLPHDITEEAYPDADPAVVYPALEAIIHGEGPPPVLTEHRLWPP
jgi:esterase/lipase